MSNHRIIKIRQNEAAIIFKNDGKIEMLHAESELHKDCVPAFAVCYAISMHKYLYDKVRAVIVNELRTKIKVYKDTAAEKQFDDFLNLLTGG